MAPDLQLLSEVAGRLARHLQDGLADLGTDGPHRIVAAQADLVPGALLDTHQMAEVLDINVRTLRRWRHEGRVPKPLKLKGPLRWRRSDVDLWLQARASSRQGAVADPARRATRTR